MTSGLCRALAVAGSALCLVATIAVAAASAVTAAPGWRVSHVFTGQPLADLLAVTATQPGDAWAFGDGKNGRPAAVHWNGRTWTISYLPHATDRPQQVSETGRTNVWAAGGGCGQVSTTPYVSRWNGSSWTTTLFPKGPCGASAVVTTGPSDGWLFNDGGGNSTAALHFNGRVWTKVSLGRVGTVISASAASRTNVWAVTFTPQNKMLVVHWNGSSWRTVAIPAAPVRRGDHAVPIQFVAAGANNLWLTTNIVDNNGVLPGQSLVLHRDGSGWHWIRVPFSDQALNAAPDGHGGLWANALTNSPSTVYDFVHYSGGKWTRQSVPSAGIPPVVGTEDVFYLALIPGTQMLWASGDAFWDTPTTSASASVMFKYVP